MPCSEGDGGKGRSVLSAAIMALPLLLPTGCLNAPTGFVVAALVADATVIAASGKSPGEHVLSVAMQSDCAVSHLVAGAALCTDPPAGTGDDLILLAATPVATGVRDPLSIDLGAFGPD